MDIRTLAVFSAGIITNDDGAVGPDYYCRTVGHADARASVSLGLHRIAGIELNVVISDYDLSSGRANHPHVAFERHEARACQWIGMQGNVLERVAVLPYVHTRTRGDDTQNQYQPGDIDRALLNDPPVDLEVADSSCHQTLFIEGEDEAPREVANLRQHRLTHAG